MKRLVIFSVLFLFATSAFAANKYVDSSATGANNGTSWANAWTSFASISMSAGDVLYVSGGTTSKTYTAQISMSAAWTLKPGAAETSPDPNHSGTVIIQYGSSGYGAVNIWSSNATVDGLVGSTRKFKFQGNDAGLDFGVFCNNGSTGLTVRGIEMTGIGSASGSTYGGGVFFLNCQGTIDDVYIHNMAPKVDYGIACLYATDATTWGRCTIKNSVIEGEVTTAGGNGSDGIKCSNGCDVFNNSVIASRTAHYTGLQHADGLQQNGVGWTRIYNNIFSGWVNYTLFMENSGRHVQIYNNYFYNTRAAVITGLRFYTGAATDWKVYNNTIVDCSDDFYPIAIGFESSQSSVTDFAVVNNVVVGCSNAITIMEPPSVNDSWQCGTDIIVDQNVSSGGVRCRGSAYTQPTYGSTSTPSFVSYTPDAGASNDMHLLPSDTVAVDHGATLTLFSTDKDGVARPQKTSWDIGAYEAYVTTTYPATPDFHLHIER